MTPLGQGERSARPATILVVDDDDGVRGASAGLLAATEHRVAVESSGHAALRRLAEVQPDVVVLDWMMPGLDGPETCRRLKADPAWRHVPVILLTALSGREHVVAGLDAGADEFLSKPVSTAPAPTSTKRVTPAATSARMESVQRTGFGTCS